MSRNMTQVLVSDNGVLSECLPLCVVVCCGAVVGLEGGATCPRLTVLDAFIQN